MFIFAARLGNGKRKKPLLYTVSMMLSPVVRQDEVAGVMLNEVADVMLNEVAGVMLNEAAGVMLNEVKHLNTSTWC